MAIKTFSVGEVLTSTDTNTYLANAGLVYLTSTTTNSSGFINFFNTLTTNYDNYKVLVTTTATGANADIMVQMANGTTPVAGILYDSAGYRITYDVNTTVAGTRDMDTDQWFVARCSASSGIMSLDMELFNPFQTQTTTFISSFVENEFIGQKFGTLKTNTSYDGFRIKVTNGWAGTATLFGYRKA